MSVHGGNGTPPQPNAPRRRAIAGSEKVLAEQWRRQVLARLHQEVAVVQAASARNRELIRELFAIEQTRRLTAEEAGQVRALRWESERLRHELDLIRERFEQLRGAGGVA